MGAMSRISSSTHPDIFLEKGEAVIFSSKIIQEMKRNYTNYITS